MYIPQPFCPRQLFITADAQKSDHRVHLYKSRDEYIVVDFFEVDKYLKEGYKRKPKEWEDIEIAQCALRDARETELEEEIKDHNKKISSLNEKVLVPKLKAGRPKKNQG